MIQSCEFFDNFAAMNRYFMHLAYKGTHYNGWQIQPNAKSIQETLQTCISTIFRIEISITGAGRTDTGVHARNFYAHFDSNHSLLDDCEKLVFKLNSFLPSDIVLYGIYQINKEAHTRFDATSRTYKYYISEKKEIFQADYCWYRNLDLNLEKMNQAALSLYEYIDFTSFSKLHTDVKTNDCKISHAHWDSVENMHVFTITADRFLRNMVRSIVGTLIEVGRDRMSTKQFREIIELKDRSKAGTSVPAKGLFLESINYPYSIK